MSLRDLRFFLLGFGIAIALIAWVPAAHAHRVARVHRGDPAWKIERVQLANLRHARTRHDRFHRILARVALREHRQLVRRFTAPWLPTADCETVGGTNGRWDWRSSVGFFEGALQFAPSTWDAERHGQFAGHAYQATPIQQVTVAARLGYDGWPNCPNP